MKHRITPEASVNLAEDDSILRAIATRKQSIDYRSSLHYLPNPDKTLKNRGIDIAVYNELLSDPLVAAATGSFKDGVKELQWEIDRGKAKSRAAELITRVFKDLDGTDEMGGMSRIIGEILDARLYGYQPIEVLWGKSGRYIVPIDIVAKPQSWFAFTPENELLFRTKANPSGEPVMPFKFICPTYEGSYDNPYGRGVLSSCFWPVTFKKGGFKFLVTFAEKYGMPWAIGKHQYTDEGKIRDFADDLDAMVQDGVMVLGPSEDVDLVKADSGSSSETIYAGLIALCREEINYAILNHNAGTSATPGKLGGEDGALEARSSVINSGKALVTQALNVVIKWVYQLNGLTGEVPRFTMYAEEDVDQDNAGRDNKLYSVGVRFTRTYMRKTYGLDDEDFWLADSESGPPTEGDRIDPITLPPWVQKIVAKTNYGVKPEFAEGRDEPDQAAVDAAATKAVDPKTPSAHRRLVKAALALIESSSSFEEALEKISEAMPNLPLADLEKELFGLFAAAGIIGADTDLREAE